MIYEPLKCLTGISQSKMHTGEIKKAKGVVTAVLCMSEGSTGIW